MGVLCALLDSPSGFSNRYLLHPHYFHPGLILSEVALMSIRSRLPPLCLGSVIYHK